MVSGWFRVRRGGRIRKIRRIGPACSADLVLFQRPRPWDCSADLVPFQRPRPWAATEKQNYQTNQIPYNTLCYRHLQKFWRADRALRPQRGRVEDGRGCSGRLRRVGPVSRPRSSNRTCGFPASGSPTGFLPQAVAGGGPRCIRRRRSTPNWPNTTRSLNRRVPRDDTFLRLRKNPRTRSHTWLSTARYAISRVP